LLSPLHRAMESRSVQFFCTSKKENRKNDSNLMKCVVYYAWGKIYPIHSTEEEFNMQPNVPQNVPVQQMPVNGIAPQDQHNYDEKIPANSQPVFPAQPMPANTISQPDREHFKPEKEKKRKKGRVRRFMKGYFLLVGVLATFALVALGVVLLLEYISPLSSTLP